MKQINAAYDYVIVGAGSAGCVLASRLSENPDIEVLLLEAGGPDSHPDVEDPVKWPTLFPGELDWGYTTAPLRSCNNRVDHVPRGKMLGGCHSHNASAWVRGHHSDFDNWAYQGCDGWGWDEALRIYKKIEDWHGPACDLRGTGGPQYVALPIDPNPIASAFVQSGPAVGIPINDDCNGAEMEGTTFFNLTIKDGKRFSVARSYLLPAMSRSNLAVVTHAETHRLLIKNGKCTGVEFERDDVSLKVHANSEVVLCAGVIGSPRILMLSGIGRADELKNLGIDVISDLPGVGQNLQDHPLIAGINYQCSVPLPPRRNNGAESTMWWHSRNGLMGPDIQPVFLEFPFATHHHAAQLPNDNCYAIAPSVVRVASRGSVTLSSADRYAPPVIDVNFMDRQADIDAALVAIEICREMGASDSFAPFRKSEIMPGNLNRTDMIEFIRNGATTYFHPTSTCKMGIDRDAVVDPRLRVYGINNLRVADASIMPDITTGNTNAPSVLIGEKAAEMILG